MVEEYLDGLRGRVDSSGVFTLALDKARDKLTRFQLHQPHQYVCHLVASGVAAGATRVEVTIDADDIVVVHDGRPLTGGQLQNLFAALLEPDTPATTVARELAIGLNSALLFEPAWIELVTSSGGFLRMQAQTQKVDRRDPLAQNRIHLKERHWRAVKRFFKKPPELEALALNCRYCPVPVVVNGANVAGRFPADNCSFELRLAHPELLLPSLEGQARWAATARSPGDYAAVIRLHRQDPSLTLVINGLAFEARPLVGARIVANLPWLPKNVSQSELLDSEPLLRLTASLRELVEQAYGELAHQAANFEEEEVRLCLAHLRSGPQGARGPLMRLPLFRGVDGGSLSGDLLWQHYAARNRLLVWSTVWDTELTPPEPVVVCDDETGPVLKSWFVNLTPADELFASFRKATVNRRAYLERRPIPLRLRDGTLAELEVNGPGFTGRLGVAGQTVANLTYLRQFKPLAVERFVEWPDGLVGIFEHPDFRPNWSWDALDPECPARAAVIEAVKQAIPELAARLEPAHEAAQPFLRGVRIQLSPAKGLPPILPSSPRRSLGREPYFFQYRALDGVWRLLEPPATGLRAGATVLDFPIAVRTDASGSEQALREGAQLAVRACVHGLAELPYEGQRAARRALLTCLTGGRDYFSPGHLAALAEAPLVPLVGGDYRSLRSLPWQDKLEFVTHPVGSPDLPLLEPESAHRLARLLGTEAVDVSGREGFLARQRQSAQLGSEMLVKIKVERPDLRGEVGLPLTPHAPRIEVQLLVQSRPWGSWLFPCPIAVEACLDLFEWGLVPGSNRLPSQRLARMAVGEAVLNALMELGRQACLEGELVDRFQSLALARFCSRFDRLPVFGTTEGGWLSLVELRLLKPPLIYSSQGESLPDRKVLALDPGQAARLRASGFELQGISPPSRLEASYPEQQWLARLAFEHDGGQAAELGVTTTRLPAELLPGIAAVPAGLDPAVLEQPLVLLIEELAVAFPQPEDPGFEVARLAVLHGLDWSQPHLAYQPGLTRARQLRLIPLPGGRMAPLDHLLDEFKTHGHVELEVEADTELAQRLTTLFPLQAPRATQPTIASGPELLAALREEFRLLSPTFPHHLLEKLRLTPLEPGLLCVYREGPLLNSEHVVICDLLRNYRPERLYLVVSALFSVVNRALPEVTDCEERAFHQQLLETLQ